MRKDLKILVTFLLIDPLRSVSESAIDLWLGVWEALYVKGYSGFNFVYWDVLTIGRPLRH